MTAIEPDIQEAILLMLPEDYDLSIELLCQLLANIMLSGKGASYETVTTYIKTHVASYEGT